MNNTKKNAVVTGGAGFIGSHLVEALVEKGYIVSIIDSLVAGKRENIPERVARAKELLDFTASVSLADGIAELKREWDIL